MGKSLEEQRSTIRINNKSGEEESRKNGDEWWGEMKKVDEEQIKTVKVKEGLRSSKRSGNELQ